MDLKPTNVSDVLLPQEAVALKHLKTRDGTPVVVMCESIDELLMSELTGGLAGMRAPEGADQIEAAGGIEAVAKLTDARARALIGAATWLPGEDGDEVRPAFWFDPNAPRHPRSLPGRLLRYEDRLTLLISILRVGNYISGGVADATSFPVHGEGVGDGVGTGPAGGADGPTGLPVARPTVGAVADGGGTPDAGEGIEP